MAGSVRASKRIVPTLVDPQSEGGDSFTLEEFSRLVETTISSTNDERRRHAESEMARLKSSKPNLYFEHLCRLMTEERFGTPLRSLAAVLLRQSLGVTDDCFDQLSERTQAGVQHSLLQAVSTERNRAVVVQISHCLSQCAVHLLCQRRKWDALMPAVFRLAESGDERQFESFLIVLAKLAEFTLDLLRPRFEQIRDYLVRALKSDSSMPSTIKKAAMKTSVAILLGIDGKKELVYWTKITPLLFENITFEAGDDVISKSCEDLHELVEHRPEFLAECMAPVIRCLCKTINDDRVDWDARRLCMGLLMTLLEHNIEHTDVNQVAEQVVPLVFQMCESVDFDSLREWQCPEDDGEQATVDYGVTVAGQLPELLTAEVFLTYGFPLIMQGLQAKDANARGTPAWVRNCGALLVIESVMNSVANHWSGKLKRIVSDVGKFIGASKEYLVGEHDERHLKVPSDLAVARLRYAALRVIKQMSVTFSEEGFQERFHDPVVSSLISFLGNAKEQHRCVLIQAADTLAHFSFGCERETFERYASPALGCLYALISESFGQCKESCCSESTPLGGVPNALLSLLDVCFKSVSVIVSILESGFDAYYPRFMHLCVEILKRTEGDHKKHLWLIRGRAIECTGQLMSNVSYDLCKNDAHRMIKLLVNGLENEHRSGSVAYNYLVRFFATMAELMGAEFEPYLNKVVPQLIESCRLQPIRMSEVPVCHSSSSLASKVGTKTLNDEWLVSEEQSVSDKENHKPGITVGDDDSGDGLGSTPALQFDGTTLTRTVKIHGDLTATERRIQVNTSELEEKSMAMDCLVTLLTCLGPAMIDYFKPIVALFMPILRSVSPDSDSKSSLLKENLNNSNSSLRRLVCESIPPLCICLRDGLKTVKGLPNHKVYQHTSGFLNEALPLLVECMESEDEVEGVAALCGYLKDLFEVVQGFIAEASSQSSSSSSFLSSDPSVSSSDDRKSEEMVDPCQFIKQELFCDLIQQLSNVVSERILRHLNCDGGSGDGSSSSSSPSSATTDDDASDDDTKGLDSSYGEEVEAQLADSLTDLFAVLALIFKDKFVEPFDRYCLQAVSELLVTAAPHSSTDSGGSSSSSVMIPSDVALGISILTEVTINGGQTAVKNYGPNLLKVCHICLTRSLSVMEAEDGGDPVIEEESADLIQSVCYAIGVLAQLTGEHGGPQLLHAPRTLASVSDWLGLLRKIVQLTRLQRDEELMCRENAVSALGKVLKYHATQAGEESLTASMAHSWICEMLPLLNDVDERVFCNGFFLDCFKRWGQQWLNKESIDQRLISKAVEVVSVALESEDSNAQELKPVLGLISARCGKTVVTEAISQLPDYLRQTLSS